MQLTSNLYTNIPINKVKNDRKAMLIKNKTTDKVIYEESYI